MTQDYVPLTPVGLTSNTTFHQPSYSGPYRVTLDDPAVDVMTDLKRITAVTVDADVSIEAARQRMINRGVRMLLVVGDDERVLGLITATDILGEKPMQFIQTRGGTHDEILVHHIMTPRENLEALRMSDVLLAKVGNIVATLKASGRQHALVIDDDGEEQAVRGIFSLSQISKQLNTVIQTTRIARTFAEIESELVR